MREKIFYAHIISYFHKDHVVVSLWYLLSYVYAENSFPILKFLISIVNFGSPIPTKLIKKTYKGLIYDPLSRKMRHIKRSMVMLFNNPVAKDSLFERFSELQLGYKPRQPC